MNIYRIVEPKYWKLLSNKEIRSDIQNLKSKGKSREVINQYLDNLNFF